MIKRFLLSAVLLVAGFAHADWAADRDGSAGYVTVTTLATAVDEAVPFCVVYLSDLPADFHTAMDAASDTDGKTIRVSTADGTTQLACVPIGVNTSTDTGCLIFLGTGMSASVDVDYRIYVGNASLSMPTASGGMGEQAVFASYAGVYFPGVDTRDWTAGGRTLTAVNSPGTAASGYEGITAAEYNGSTQYHKYEGAQAVTGPPYTLESLIYVTNTTARNTAVQIATSTGAFSVANLTAAGDLSSPTTDPIRAAVLGGSGSASAAVSSAGYSASTWTYAASSRSGTTTGTTTAYKDGGSSGTESTTIAAFGSVNRLAIGVAINNTITNYLAGRIAVALLSSSVRSADYVSTMQDNWAGTMYSAGAWTALGSCNSGSTGWVLFTAVAQSSSADMNWTNPSNVLIDDSTYAWADLESGVVENTEYLNLTDIDFDTTTIPVGADSYTVQVRVKKYRGAGGGDEINDLTVQFIDETGTRIGDNLADTATDWPTGASTFDYTITGHTFDGTEFDADSGLAFRATGNNGASISQARFVTGWMKIDWQCGDSGAASRGFFALTE